MPLYLRQNQYRGINAHLHSALQNTPEGWLEFHGLHISHLAQAIDRQLPSGYIARLEKSFQIRAFHTEQTTARAAVEPANNPTLVISTEEQDDELFLTAVSIRPLDETGMGKPVTWLELLSPTNMPGQSGFSQYYAKRVATLRGGIALVEVDYLHEYPPVLRQLPDDRTDVYGIEVDSPLPRINIPLVAPDVVLVDFGKIYDQTFESMSAFSIRADYLQETTHFDRYTAEDQKRIRARMQAVQA